STEAGAPIVPGLRSLSGEPVQPEVNAMERQSLLRRERRGVRKGIGVMLLGLASLHLLWQAPAAAEPAGGALRVSAGIVDHQVVQRGTSGAADIELSGTAPPEASGAVSAIIRHAGKPLRGFEDREIGRSEAGAWSAALQAVPAGGPYRIELSVRDRGGRSLAAATVDDVLVGDLWLLAGQSNMQGAGLLENVEPPSDRVHSFDLADRWVVASEPLHRLLEAVDPVYWGGAYPNREERERAAAAIRAKETKGAGLGLPFATDIVRRTGIPIGLIPCALGGTAIARWDPALRDQGGASLYGALVRRFRAAGGRVTGVLWYQGEADARQPAAAAIYGERLRGLIEALRRDSGQPALPFYFVQLGRMLEWIYFPDPSRRPATLDAQWTAVREAERRVAADVPATGMVPAADLELEDSIHINTGDLKRVARRLARLVARDVYGERPLEAAISLHAIEHDPAAERILVRFAGVHGRLRSAGRITGFSIRREDGSEVPAIFAAQVDPSDPATVVLRYQWPLPARVGLVYGWGINPNCNLVDDADMAPPCFGPVELSGHR
ncbi:MAG: hypothetical protein DMG07_14770, partial [Acidobacteria bacterium]